MWAEPLVARALACGFFFAREKVKPRRLKPALLHHSRESGLLRRRVQPPPQFLLAFQETPQLASRSRARGGGKGLNLFLDGRQFLFGLAAAQDRQAAFG